MPTQPYVCGEGRPSPSSTGAVVIDLKTAGAVGYQGSIVKVSEGGLVLIAGMFVTMAWWFQPCEARNSACVDGSFDFWSDAAGLAGEALA